MSDEYIDKNNIDRILTIDEINEHIEKVKYLRDNVMVKGIDIGIIPGCDKPSLLQSGAEMLALYFNFTFNITVTYRDLENNHREYVAEAMIVKPSGRLITTATGICTTMESKYRYRNAKRICPHCGKDAIIKGREEFGGGWLCWDKRGGCGAQWPDSAPDIISQSLGKIENDSIADEYNTALQVATKRSIVPGAKRATYSSSIFTAGLEDMTSEQLEAMHIGNTNTSAKPVTTQQQQPQSIKRTKNGLKSTTAATAKPTKDIKTATIIIHRVIEQNGVSNKTGKPYTMWIIQGVNEGEEYATFSESVKNEADKLVGIEVNVEYEVKGKYTNVQSVYPVSSDNYNQYIGQDVF